MALFRNIYTTLWDDQIVVENMNDTEKLMFLYLLTNRSTTQIGIYKITIRQMAFDLCHQVDTIKQILKKLEHELNLIVYDEVTTEIAIKNWGKYNLNRGGKPFIDCIKKELREVKNKEFIKLIASKIEKSDVKEVFYAYYDDSNTNRGQEEEKEEKEEKEGGNEYNESFNSRKANRGDNRKIKSSNKGSNEEKIKQIEQYLREK